MPYWWQKALQFFGNREQLAVELKGPQDYVSVEKLIISHLKAFFPDDGFLGEESGEVQTSVSG